MKETTETIYRVIKQKGGKWYGQCSQDEFGQIETYGTEEEVIKEAERLLKFVGIDKVAIIRDEITTKTERILELNK